MSKELEKFRSDYEMICEATHKVSSALHDLTILAQDMAFKNSGISGKQYAEVIAERLTANYEAFFDKLGGAKSH